MFPCCFALWGYLHHPNAALQCPGLSAALHWDMDTNPGIPPMPLSAYLVASSWALLRSNNLSLALQRVWGTVCLDDETHYLFISQAVLVPLLWQGMAALPSPLPHACSWQPQA